MERESHKTICKRLHYLIGQLIGIDKMWKENRNPADVLNVFLAVESGLDKLIHEKFDEALRFEIAYLLNKLSHKFKHNTEVLERLENIRVSFPHYTLKQLPKILAELQKLSEK